MRLLLDENAGRRVWRDRLLEAGHDIERVVDVGLRGQPDSAVLHYALQADRIIITRDKAHDQADDLVALWTKVDEDRPSLVVIFPGDLITIAEVLRTLKRVEESDFSRNQICVVNVWGKA